MRRAFPLKIETEAFSAYSSPSSRSRGATMSDVDGCAMKIPLGVVRMYSKSGIN